MAANIDIKLIGDNRNLKRSLDEAEGFLSGFGGKAKLAVAGAGVAAAATLGASFVESLDRQALGVKFGAQLGLGAEQAKNFIRQAGDVYSQAWGGSVEEVAASMAAISNASFGDDVGDELESITKQAYAVAEAFDVDISEAIQTASELVESGLAGSADEAFDLLTAGLAEMPAAIRGELFEASQEYDGFFAALGVSGAEAFGLLTTFAEGGKIGIDKAGDAIKEFGIRATDMSANSVAAFESAGLSADEMAAAILAGGSEARAGFDTIIAGLLAIEDPTEQAAAAIALFGTPLEDLSVSEIPGFLEGLGRMGEGFDVTKGGAAELGDELGQALSTKIEALKRQGFEVLIRFMEDKVLPAVEAVAEWFQRNWPAMQATIEQATERISAVVDQYWPRIRDVIVSAVELVQITIQRVTEAIELVWSRWGEDIQRITSQMWENLQRYIGGALEVITGIIRTFTAILKGDWQGAWDGIKQVLEGVWMQMTAIIDAAVLLMKTLVSAGWEAIKSATSTALELIRLSVEGAFNAVITFLTGLPGTLYSLAKAAFDRLKDGIVDAVSGIPGIILDKVLGPLDEIAGKIAGIVGSIGGAIGKVAGVVIPGGGGSGGSSSGGPSTSASKPVPGSQAAQDAADKALLDAVAKNPSGGTSGRKAGGGILAELAAGSGTVGSPFDPMKWSHQPGAPLVGTMYVTADRTIEDELRLAFALEGVG